MESLFTIERLMHYLNLKKSQIDYLIENGLIPHFKLPNGEILFRASEIEQWLLRMHSREEGGHGAD